MLLAVVHCCKIHLYCCWLKIIPDAAVVVVVVGVDVVVGVVVGGVVVVVVGVDVVVGVVVVVAAEVVVVVEAVVGIVVVVVVGIVVANDS